MKQIFTKAWRHRLTEALRTGPTSELLVDQLSLEEPGVLRKSKLGGEIIEGLNAFKVENAIGKLRSREF